MPVSLALQIATFNVNGTAKKSVKVREGYTCASSAWTTLVPRGVTAAKRNSVTSRFEDGFELWAHRKDCLFPL